jgi:hypothetical protein
MEKINKQVEAIKKDKYVSEIENTELFIQVFDSIKSGVKGFFIVFSLVILTKFLSTNLIHIKEFSFSISDFVISFWGFIILSFVIFVSHIKDPRK